MAAAGAGVDDTITAPHSGVGSVGVTVVVNDDYEWGGNSGGTRSGGDGGGGHDRAGHLVG